MSSGRTVPVRCPRCPSELRSVPGQPVDLQMCLSCGGELYPAAELIQVEGEAGPDGPWIEQYLDLSPSQAERIPSLRCPACSHEMDTFDVSGLDDCQVDLCRACGCAWVDGQDAGQLRRRIRERMRSGSSPRPTSSRIPVVPRSGDPNVIDLSDGLAAYLEGRTR